MATKLSRVFSFVVPIAGPDSDPRNADLAGDTCGNQTQVAIEHVEGQVGQRSPDGHVVQTGQQRPVDHMLANIVGGLGRAHRH